MRYSNFLYRLLELAGPTPHDNAGRARRPKCGRTWRHQWSGFGIHDLLGHGSVKRMPNPKLHLSRHLPVIFSFSRSQLCAMQREANVSIESPDSIWEGRPAGGSTVSLAVATAIVVADMVGVGVFTSL